MKAIVKATGEIVEVYQYGKHFYIEYVGERASRTYHPEELDLLDSPDYWTRLEHQYAGMAMQGILANINLLTLLAKKKADDYHAKYFVAEFAKDCAHALVEKMKEKMK